MRVYYSDEVIDDNILKEYDHSIFLAGPTPRDKKVKSWRPDALKILEDLEYDGLVFVPELEENEGDFNYLNQVEWEKWGLESCKKIVFWVPRKIPEMSAYTTNVEFGRYVDSGRAVYGRPNDAEKCDYLDWMYEGVTGDKPFDNLEETLKKALKNE